MKKLLVIVVLGLMWCNVGVAEINIILKCEVTLGGKVKDVEAFGSIKGAINYYQITDEVNTAWDVYNQRFKRWSKIIHMGKKYITFYSYGGNGGIDSDATTRIDRETGSMIHLWRNLTYSDYPRAECEKIDYQDLPVKEVEQKF